MALSVVILFEIWKSAPFTFLFVTARLQNVPAELEDAAAIDGANARQRLTHIVLPQLRTVVMVLLLLRFIWSFQNFNDIYLLTQRSEEHTSELQSRGHLVCRLLLEKKNILIIIYIFYLLLFVICFVLRH